MPVKKTTKKTQEGKGFIKNLNKMSGLNSDMLNNLDNHVVALDKKLRSYGILNKLNKIGVLQPIKHAASLIPYGGALLSKALTLGQ